MGKRKSHICSNWNLRKNSSCNSNSFIVKSAKADLEGQKNNDASFREGFSAVDRKQSGWVKEGTQVDPASKVSIDNDLNKMETCGLWPTSKNRYKGNRKKGKRKTFIDSFVLTNKKEASGSMGSENTDTVKNIHLHPGIPSKSDMNKKNSIGQTMSAKEENNSLQRNTTIFAANDSNLPPSPKYTLQTPQLKYTYSKRFKKSRQRGKNPHSSSNLNLQVSGSGHSNRSLHIQSAAETGCGGKRNHSSNSASVFEDFSQVDEKGGGCSLNNIDTSTTRIIWGRVKKPRRRNKNKKTIICSDRTVISEKDVSGSIKSEIIDSVERGDLDPEICSKSEMGNVNLNSGEAHEKIRNRARKGKRVVSVDGFMGSSQLCDVPLKLSNPENEGLCHPKWETSIEQKPNMQNEETCPYSSVEDVVNDGTSDASIKENITLDNINMPLRRGSINCSKKKLLVLDLNGLLVDVIYEHRTSRRAPIRIAGKSVYKRPFCEEFLEFCFERFDVGIWSSRKSKNINAMVNFLFGETRSQLHFCWDLSKCTTTGFKTLENVHKPLVLKELKKLWNKDDEDLPWAKGDYSPSNTLLIDDSPYKALGNPPHTAIFPSPYDHRNENDNALGVGGDLRVYLEGLAVADNVQSYVKGCPFGQHAIAPENPSWGFYLRIIEKMNASFAPAVSHSWD